MLFTVSSIAQNPMTIDLHTLVKKNGIEVYNREMSLINEEGYQGIRLSKDYGEGVAWLRDIDFSEGVLEFDVRGEDLEQHSFVGIAFHGQNDSTYESVYLRPFRFNDTDVSLRSHSIQYISLPKFTWRILRTNSPGLYEATIEPTPEPDAWVHVRLIVKDEMVSIFINRSKEPSLVVKSVTHETHGAIGFYVADTSGGDFANVKVTKQ